MKKVKIGNDIKIQVSLSDNPELKMTNVRKLKCYLVNDTLFENIGKKCGGLYILNICGCPTYHVLPRCKHPEFLCCRDAAIFDKAPICEDKTKYLAESDIDYTDNVINIYFPAKDQIIGVYRLIVVMETYVSGWGKHELKTNTIEYKDVLEIAMDGDEQYGEVTIISDIVSSSRAGYVGFLNVRPYSKDEESDEIGFDRSDDSFENEDQESYDSIGIDNVNTDNLQFVKNLSKPTTIVNHNDGYYLWVVSKIPISNITDENSMHIPFAKGQYNSNTKLYYYCCSNPMLNNESIGGISVKVNF